MTTDGRYHLDEAREAARIDHTTLNEQLRLWLEDYARRRRVQKFEALMAEIKGQYSRAGKHLRGTK